MSKPTAPSVPAAQPSPPPAKPAAAAVGVECPYCHQWETSADDGYCGFCGHLLLPLEVEPESVILISTLAPKREVVFRNASRLPLRAVIVPRGGPKFPALSFEPSGTFEIAPDSEAKVQVELDAALLPAEFQAQLLDYVCLVNDDPRKQFALPITVRAGPRPKLLSAALQFGDVQEGRVVERPLELANSGGTPLRVTKLSPQGSPRLRLASTFSETVLHPGQRLTAAVLWDSNVKQAEEAAEAAGVRVSFGNYPETVFVPARAKTFRYALELKPAKIQLRDVLAKEDRAVRVQLENRGTTNLEIDRIECDEDWLEVISRARGFTLLCAENAAQQSDEQAPTRFAKTYDFKVVCRPQRLAAGKHHGRVRVRPVGQEQKVLEIEIDVIRPQPYNEYIGIDFGTTNSVVAVFDQSNYEIELVEDEVSRSPLIPSVLVFEDADTYKIGQAAKNELNLAPDRSVRSVKRIMGYEHEREFFGRKFAPEDLATCIIRKLTQMCEAKLLKQTGTYFDVGKAIITVPANFFDLQVRAVLAACEAAGLDTEEEKVKQAAQATHAALGQAVNAGVILDEPSAAVLYYIYHLSRRASSSELTEAIGREGGLRLLVFDYGGGTLDVSIANVTRLESREAGLKVLANMGDNGIGGDSIDLLLMGELLAKCKEALPKFEFEPVLIAESYKKLEARRDREAWSQDVWKHVLRVRSEWKDLSETAKIELSNRPEAVVEVRPDLIVRVADGQLKNAPQAVKLTVVAATLEDLMQSVLAKCNRLVESALDLAGLEPGQIDYILHTGRQSQMRLIRQRLKEMFPEMPADRDLLELEHLKVCVAKGAVLYGWMRDRLIHPEARIHFLSEGRLLPHSYGVEKFSNFMQPELDEIIARGRPYPTAESKTYGPEMIPPSGQLNLKFYQNTGSRKAILRNPEVSLIGQVAVNTLADGVPGCVVRVVIDANRKLEVFADENPVPIQPVRLHGEESWIG